jgi:hypothetical protein
MTYLKPISILISITIIFFACTKVDNVDKRPFSYSLEGIKDVVVPSNFQQTLSIKAKLLTGNPANEPITVSVEGLPTGIKVDSSSFTFKLNKDFAFTFHSNNAAEGIYPIRIVAANNTTGTQVYNINLTVGPQANCIVTLPSYYDATSSCFANTVTGDIDTVPGILNRMKITIPQLFDIYADVDCVNSTFDIPVQQVQGDTTLQGRGYYYYEYVQQPHYIQRFLRVHIDDTLVYGAQVISTCSIEMSHRYYY